MHTYISGVPGRRRPLRAVRGRDPAERRGNDNSIMTTGIMSITTITTTHVS